MRSLTLILLLLIAGRQSFAQLQIRVKELAEKHYQKHDFTGVVGVVDSASAVAVSFGYEDESKFIPVSQYSTFSLASITKVFTGMAVLKSIEKGHVANNDPIGKWIPELQPALQKVTVQQLANHTAAVHDFYSLGVPAHKLNDSSAFELLTALDSTVYEPGLRYGYSNSHYLLLAIMLERVEKKAFEDLITELFFDPLNMVGAGFFSEGAMPIVGFLDNGRKAMPRADVMGEAGIIVTSNDMLAFGRGLMINEDLKALILGGIEFGQEYDPDPSWTYAYGWFCTTDERGPFCACSGRGFGALAYQRWYYKEDQYYFMLTNRESLPSFKAFREDVATLLPAAKP